MITADPLRPVEKDSEVDHSSDREEVVFEIEKCRKNVDRVEDKKTELSDFLQHMKLLLDEWRKLV